MCARVASAAPPAADLVLLDARIYTADPAHSMAQGLAVKDGRIVFVGDALGTRSYVGPRTRVVGAGGRLVLPGLVDAHIHPTLMVDFDACSLEGRIMPLADLATAVRRCRVAARIRKGEWLYVTLWESGAGNDPDPRLRNLRAALDAAAPDNPVFMTGTDGHHAAYNSAALARARNGRGDVVGLSRATLRGDFASYSRFIGVDEHGEPSGDVNDAARALIDTSSITKAQHARLLEHPELVMDLLLSRGITAVQDAWTHDSDMEIYDALIAKGGLKVWLNMAQYHRPEAYADAHGDIDYTALFATADAVRRKYAGNELTRADALKLFADGSTESNPNTVPPTLGNSPKLVPYLQPIFGRDAHGDLTVTGYADPASAECLYVRANPESFAGDDAVARFTRQNGFHPAQCALHSGAPTEDPAIFKEYVKQAHLRGYTLHIHVIGDAAVRMSIDAIEAARAADGISSQPDTLAHVEFAAPEDVLRMGRDHLYLAYTYSWAYAEPTGYDMTLVPFYDHVSGNDYAALHRPDSYFERTYYPVKTSLDAGAVLVAGSDAPVSTKDPQPFVNMEFALTRAKRGFPPTGPWQRLSIRDVLDAYTRNGARSLGREKDIGSLEVGKSADFCMLNEDIIALADAGAATRIGDARVLATWFRGVQVYKP